jgi:hypothetical protein
LAENSPQQRIAGFLRKFVQDDLRPSYLIIAAMVLIGAVINLSLSHGWTVWPFVGAIGIMTYMNEAADRNGQGIPPFRVYAVFFGALLVWLIAIIILSALNPLIILLGIAVILYRAGQAHLQQRQRDQLVATRRLEGRCIHCGELYDPNVVLCESCGEEPNPDVALLTRVAEVYRTPQQMARARAMLTKAQSGSSASAKEAALLVRRRSSKKTADIGSSSKSSKHK